MPSWKCPVCGRVLQKVDRVFSCSGGHSFDIAKQGYVNLLMSNKSSDKRHGDDKAMARARSEFLEKGYYLPLRDAISELAAEHTTDFVNMLDVGCGEGWYSEGIIVALENAGKGVHAAGIDISREVLVQAAKRGGKMALAVGSVNKLPVMDEKTDLIINIFAPSDETEFLRVLKTGGTFIKAMPLERHLYSLKAAVYDKPYENPPVSYTPEGFELLERRDIKEKINLSSNEDIKALFLMTPYYYKTSAKDQSKLDELTELETEIEFCVEVFKKT